MGKKGFSLLEIAFVLIIMGVLLAGGLSFFAVYVKNSKLKETQSVVDNACEALKGYAQNKGALPAPVDTNGDGILEIPSDIGVRSIDAYNQYLVYNVASNIDSIDFCQDEPTSLITIDDRGTTKNNIAFIIYSKSENIVDDTACSQSPSPCSTTGVDYQIRDYGELTATGKNYDDIVCYLDINILREKSCPAFEITTSSFPIGTQYLTYPTSTITVVNGTLSSCSLSGNLPLGLIFNSSSCSISGTPEEAGTFNITITANDTIGRSASKTFTLTINPNPVRIETASLPYAFVGQDYAVGLSASGATGSYTWSLINNGGLAGLTLSNTGILSIAGTSLTTTGVYTITVQVCDSTYTSECDNKQFLLTVTNNSASSGSGGSSSSGGGTGGGGGGSTCTAYDIHIIKSSFSGSDYVEAVDFGTGCQRISLTRNYYTFTGVTSSTVDFFDTTTCSNTPVLSYNLASIDTDNDCVVYIACNGDSSSCKIYNTPMVYCPIAKFYDTGSVRRMKINGTGSCLNDPQVNSIADIYTYRNTRCSIFLCSYTFTQEFSTSIDQDYDCDVSINESCVLSDR